MSGGVAADTSQLREAVDLVASLDCAECVDAALADTFIEVRREIDQLEALAARLLVNVEGRGIPFGEGASSTSAWSQWRTGQRWKEAKASCDAGALSERLPLTAKAWAQGEISTSAAKAITRGIKTGHEDEYAELEEMLVDLASERNFRDLDAVIGYYGKCCDALDDPEPEDKNGLHLSKVGERWVSRGDFDGLGGEILLTAIRAAMDTPNGKDDQRSAARLRADALVNIARWYLNQDDLPEVGGEAPHVSIVFQWSELHDILPISAVPRDPDELAALLSSSQRD